jgi:hypothetical protein
MIWRARAWARRSATAAARPLSGRWANSQVRATGTFETLRLVLQRGGYRWRFAQPPACPLAATAARAAIELEREPSWNAAGF